MPDIIMSTDKIFHGKSSQNFRINSVLQDFIERSNRKVIYKNVYYTHSTNPWIVLAIILKCISISIQFSVFSVYLYPCQHFFAFR